MSILVNKAKRTYVITLIGILLAAENIGSNSFVRDATSVRNSKCRRLRSVFWLLSWQPTTLNLSILLLCIHENRRRFESQNGSHMALFSAPMCSCCQRITRHNANYAQMPGCPLCSIVLIFYSHPLAAGGRVSDIAHEVILPKVPDNACGRFWGVSTDSRLCAGYDLAHKGICPVRTLTGCHPELANSLVVKFTTSRR